MQFFHGQLLYKFTDLFWTYYKQPIGLVPVTGDLGQELVWRNPCGDRNANVFFHFGANLFGDAGCAAGELRALTNVQIRFIQRKRFNQIGIAPEDLVYLCRCPAILFHVGAYDDQVGAAFARGG